MQEQERNFRKPRDGNSHWSPPPRSHEKNKTNRTRNFENNTMSNNNRSPSNNYSGYQTFNEI